MGGMSIQTRIIKLYSSCTAIEEIHIFVQKYVRLQKLRVFMNIKSIGSGGNLIHIYIYV